MYDRGLEEFVKAFRIEVDKAIKERLEPRAAELLAKLEQETRRPARVHALELAVSAADAGEKPEDTAARAKAFLGFLEGR